MRLRLWDEYMRYLPRYLARTVSGSSQPACSVQPNEYERTHSRRVRTRVGYTMAAPAGRQSLYAEDALSDTARTPLVALLISNDKDKRRARREREHK